MRQGVKKRTGVLTMPLARGSIAPLSHLVEILSYISTSFTLVTGNEGYMLYKNEPRFIVYDVSYKITVSIWKVFNFLYGQVLASLILIYASKDVDCWFFLGGPRSVMPIILAKAFNKKLIIVMIGSLVKDCSLSQDKFLKFIEIFSFVSLSLADKIIIYSPNLIQEWDLGTYQQKILIAHEHFLDFNTFTITTPLHDRLSLIGYIGRLSEEKGVRQFAQALPAILSDRQDLRVLLGGDGKLKDVIEAVLQEEGIVTSVDLAGWISHDDLPAYLNKLRLLVLPSYTEGLPNIMLEAMACGTPVLVTSVGAIPDVVVDGKTGFIMDNNSPECIAANVIRALRSQDLEQIAENGRRFVEEHFTFEKTVENWKKILQDIE